MRFGHHSLDNLAAQRPLRREDGRWNLAIIVDRNELAPQSQPYFDRVVKAAARAGVHCQENWSRLPDYFDNICVVAHNHPTLQHHLIQWGENGWFKGRYLILLVCGQAGAPPLETKHLFDNFGVTGSLTPVYQIEIAAVASVIEALLLKGKDHPDPLQKAAWPRQPEAPHSEGNILSQLWSRLQALWYRYRGYQ